MNYMDIPERVFNVKQWFKSHFDKVVIYPDNHVHGLVYTVWKDGESFTQPMEPLLTEAFSYNKQMLLITNEIKRIDKEFKIRHIKRRVASFLSPFDNTMIVDFIVKCFVFF